MSKIATYSLADSPLQLSDRLIGTEAARPIPSPTPLATKNFSLGELLQLFSSNFPAATLQAVLDAGNIATQDITLTGTMYVDLIKPTNIEDMLGSQGTPFQILSKAIGGFNWVDPPVSITLTTTGSSGPATLSSGVLNIPVYAGGVTPNLQQVTDVDNVTTNPIIIQGVGDASAKQSIYAQGAFELTDINGENGYLAGVADSASNEVGFRFNVLNTINSDILLKLADGYFTQAFPNTNNLWFNIPYKQQGIYTLATLDDIPSYTTPNLTEVLTIGDIESAFISVSTNTFTTIQLGSQLTYNYVIGTDAVGSGGIFLDKTILFPINSTIVFQAGYVDDSANTQNFNSYKFTTDAVVYYKGSPITEVIIGANDKCTLKCQGEISGIQYWILDVVDKSTIPTLQQVTDEGAITTNLVTFGDSGTGLYTEVEGQGISSYDVTNNYFSQLVASGLFTLNTSSNQGVSVLPSEIILQTSGVGAVYLKSDNLLVNYTAQFPVKALNSTQTIAMLSDIPAAGVTSVGLTMPSAFTVTNSPITSSGDIAVTGAGAVSQYVRGDGTLANFPTSSGGGSSLSFYLNGSVSQGTFGGVAFREMDRTPILGAGTDFTINANGYIQSFITDAGVPNLLEIPAGNWNFETYFSASSGGGSPSFYVELYKWDGATLSLIASSSANPEFITGGTNTDLYVSALAVPQTTLLATDRLAVRIYVTHSGRTIKLHTEDNNLCQVITTFSTGLTALNGLTAQVQNLAVGTTGTDFAINSTTATHTFNLPTASATNRGALSSTDWSTFNNKQNDLWTFYTKQGFIVWEDFMGGSFTATVENWGVSTRVPSGGGGGETITQTDTFPNRTTQQGVISLSTGTNAAGSLLVRAGNFNNSTGTFFGNGEVVFETYVNINTLSTVTERFWDLFGFWANTNYNGVAAYGFVYDEGGVLTNLGSASPNFKCTTFNGITRSNTTTTVAVTAQQWYKLRIVVNANNTQVQYFIDDVVVATHTSGTGVTSLSPRVVHTKTAGTTSRILYMDYFGIKQTFTSQR